jgi:protein-S-isoprenylcysteine O-methyltransferase Ste14
MTPREPSSARDTPGVIAPPPLIYLAGLLIGAGLDWAWPAPFLPQTWQYAVGGAMIAAGGAVALACIYLFRRHGTHIEPYRPSLALVTGGPYRRSRNPIYVALTLSAAGTAVAVDSAWMLAMLVPVLLVMHFGVIRREEAYLETKFGDAYRGYRDRTRRWL